MDCNLEKESSALGGLFQCIINELRSSTPLFEDLVLKGAKLQLQLRTTLQFIDQFLDSLQRVADVATHAKGATRDIGTALTRICMRHRSIENRLKTLCSALGDCLCVPLQEKLDDWKRNAATLDKEHTREYKRLRGEIKKRSIDTCRLQKKARKGSSGAQRQLDSSTRDFNESYSILIDAERRSCRQALVEQRSQFCLFVSYFKPVADGELALLNELSHLQEVVEQLCKHAADPFTLPAPSEAVIADIRGLLGSATASDTELCVTTSSTGYYRTPPSSPDGSYVAPLHALDSTSSLGSRKSSFCSLSSSESAAIKGASTYPATPLHHATGTGNTPAQPTRFSSIDSGFRSQDALLCSNGGNVFLRTQRMAVDEEPPPVETPASSDNQSPPYSIASWPEVPDDCGGALSQAMKHLMAASPRPHTISVGNSYRSTRPGVSEVCFVPPSTRPNSLSIEQQRKAPPVAAKPVPMVPSFNRLMKDQVMGEEKPIYVNLGMAPPAALFERPTRGQRPSSFVGTDDVNDWLPQSASIVRRSSMLSRGPPPPVPMRRPSTSLSAATTPTAGTPMTPGYSEFENVGMVSEYASAFYAMSMVAAEGGGVENGAYTARANLLDEIRRGVQLRKTSAGVAPKMVAQQR